MRIFTSSRLYLTGLCLLLAGAVAQAQEQEQARLVVVQKTVQEDGTVTVVKKSVRDREEAKAYLKSLGDQEGREVDIQVFDPEKGHVKWSPEEGETVLFFRRAKTESDHEGHSGEQEEDLERLRIVIHEDVAAEMAERKVIVRESRPFLGVYLDENGAGEGVTVSNVVSGSGAEAAGLRAGDVILSLDGQPLNSVEELRRILAGRAPGDNIDVSFRREGQSQLTEATLGNRRSHWERDPCAVFIGVTLSGSGPDDRGVHVDQVIEGTPAEAAQLQAGDVITALDGIAVNTYDEVLRERNKHQPGDRFTLTVLRSGGLMDVAAQFNSCEQEPEALEEMVEEAPALPEAPAGPVDPQNRLELLDYQVFPNPTVGKLNLRFSGEALPTTVRVIGVDGQVLHQENLNRFDGYYNGQIDLSRATPGTYFLQIRQGEKVLAEKVVVVPRA